MTILDRIDGHSHIPADHLREDPPLPDSVKIELTRNCNYKCSFCNHPNLADKTGSMDWGLYLDTLAELRDAGVKEVAPFFFGESFIDPRLPAAVRAAREAGFTRIYLTTNGSVATPEKVRECIEAGLTSLKFSINFADADQFVDVTRVKRSLFDRSIENVKAARAVRDEVEAATGHRCELSISYIKYDGKQGERMSALLEDLAPFVDTAYALPTYNQAGTAVRDGWEFSGGNPGRLEAMVEPVPCWKLFTATNITYDGDVYACPFYVGDQFDMGNLNDMTFEEAWHSEKFRALRRAHLAGDIRGTPCEGCVKQKAV